MWKEEMYCVPVYACLSNVGMENSHFYLNHNAQQSFSVVTGKVDSKYFSFKYVSLLPYHGLNHKTRNKFN